MALSNQTMVAGEVIPGVQVGQNEVLKRRNSQTGHYTLALSTGGVLPPEMNGAFTSDRAVNDAINRYKASVNKRNPVPKESED